MPNPTVGFLMAGTLVLGLMPSAAYALTVADCINYFGTKCPTYTVSGTMCKCSGCDGTVSDNVTFGPDGVYLDGSCSTSSGDSWLTGPITCNECNQTTNPCMTARWEINGKIFCRYQTPQANCDTGSNVLSSVMASRCCQNGYGIVSTNATKCITVSCTAPLGPDETYSSCRSCTNGYYNKNGSTPWLDPLCEKCPTQDGATGTTNIAPSAITDCYMPTYSTMTDTTGTYQFTTECYYTE